MNLPSSLLAAVKRCVNLCPVVSRCPAVSLCVDLCPVVSLCHVIAAAIDQLVTLGSRIEVPVFELGTDVKPPEIARCVQRLAVAPFRTWGLGLFRTWA